MVAVRKQREPVPGESPGTSRRNESGAAPFAFQVQQLRPPATPMSDRELGEAIAEFRKDAPSAEAVSDLGPAN
jgi:hypothetical protein